MKNPTKVYTVGNKEVMAFFYTKEEALKQRRKYQEYGYTKIQIKGRRCQDI